MKQMAEKHPYASPGAIGAAVLQFKKSFPAKVSADTLKKLAIAPNNESYVINTLRFINCLDAEGSKTDKATSVFSQHDQVAFQQAFGEMVKSAYSELFSLHGDGAWDLHVDGLISFFRNHDQTSDIVGRRQAATFQMLASLAGHGEISVTAKQAQKPVHAREQKAKPAGERPKGASDGISLDVPAEKAVGANRDVGLTVRIEVNLPTGADQDTYDRIFRSIRENLISAGQI